MHDHKPVLLFMCENIAEWSNCYQNKKEKKVEGAGEEPDVDAWLLCLHLHVRPEQFKLNKIKQKKQTKKQQKNVFF